MENQGNMTTGEALTILYVEDDPEAFLIVQTLIKRKVQEKVEIWWASSGREAIKKSEDGRIDLIFLDYMLPDMDGLVVLEKIRAAGVTAPAVLLTGYGSEEVASAAFKKGVIDYMSKHFENIDRAAEKLLSYVEYAGGLAKVHRHVRSFDDLTKSRDSQIILADMLRTAANGTKKTHLLHRANLNSSSIKKYLAYAVTHEYLQWRGDSSSGIYVTTPKGMELLGKMNEVRELLV